MRLPIDDYESTIISLLDDHQVVIVVGEPGSGKTTRIPLFLRDAGYADEAIIGITEPRRIAALSASEYVSSLLETPLGETVGYVVRHDSRVSAESDIVFMTDGILLRELLGSPDLNRYSVIVVDEAHERSLNIDVSLGLLKKALARNPEFRVIVSSATLHYERFSRYFGGAPVVNVSGRTYPVEISYAPAPPSLSGQNAYMCDAVVREVLAIARKPYARDDVLVFLSGEDEIMRVAHMIREYNGLQDVEVLPLYSAMMPEDQKKIFGACARRKVILATNIAETSLTIDGVSWVIDSGYIKQMEHNPETGVSTLSVTDHSQAGCTQRAGRAGRTGPGRCVRLYDEKDFLKRPAFTTPEILRSDLASVVLQMIAMGIRDVETFDFMDAPDARAFRAAHESLRLLGAITHDNALTPTGVLMAASPLPPRHTRQLIAARDAGCVASVATIVAFDSLRNPFIWNRERSGEIDAAHWPFKSRTSDFETFLRLYDAYLKSGRSREWCYKHFVNSRVMEEAVNIRKQVIQFAERNGFPIRNEPDGHTRITRAMAAGLAGNICIREGRKNRYVRATDDAPMDYISIHPGSGLFTIQPAFIMASSFVTSNERCYARGCAELDREKIPELFPQLVRSVRSEVLRANLLARAGVVMKTWYLGEYELFREDCEATEEEMKKYLSALPMRVRIGKR